MSGFNRPNYHLYSPITPANGERHSGRQGGEERGQTRGTGPETEVGTERIINLKSVPGPLFDPLCRVKYCADSVR